MSATYSSRSKVGDTSRLFSRNRIFFKLEASGKLRLFPISNYEKSETFLSVAHFEQNNGIMPKRRSGTQLNEKVIKVD